MAKPSRFRVKKKGDWKLLVFILFILLVLSAILFLFYYFVLDKTNNYFIENKYYGFKIETPKNWIAEANNNYSGDNADQFFVACSKDQSKDATIYEIGKFRFEDKKYSPNISDTGVFPAGSPTGAILDIAVNCIPDGVKNNLSGYGYSNLIISGQQAFDEFLNLAQSVKVRYISFFYKNLQYKISEYVYVSPSDKNKDSQSVWESYADTFNKIISSFNITK